MISKKTCILLLFVIAGLVALVNLLYGPIAQPEAYHHFADTRDWFGIENYWNVLSNFAFAAAGFSGLYLLLTPGKIVLFDQRTRWPWLGVSVGLILTAIGSGFYHLAPDNFRLVWDRLPMTFVFMSLIAALICERVDIRFGLALWPLLLVIGFSSVILWHSSELRGSSDLRVYLGVQEFAILATLVLMLTDSPYDRSADLAVVILFYGIARLFEIYDRQVYMFSKGLISGHTIKHLSAAMGGIWLMRMLMLRRINKGP